MKTAEKLLDAAERRMRRGGYNAVSFRDLAEDVEIKSASVHYHFPTKEDLALSLVKRYAARVFERLGTLSEGAETPQHQLQAFSKVYELALKEDGAVCLCVLLGAEMPALPEDVRVAVQKFFDANIDWVEGNLPNDMANSEKRRRAIAFVAAHQGTMMMAAAADDPGLFTGLCESLMPAMLEKNAA